MPIGPYRKGLEMFSEDPAKRLSNRSDVIPKGSEARRTPRRVYNRAIGVLYNGQYNITQGLQISEGGMLFRSNQPIPTKGQIVVSVVLPGGAVIVSRGEVIYERSDADGFRQFGVRFKDLPIQQRRVIRNYVTAKTQAEAEEEAEVAKSSAA